MKCDIVRAWKDASYRRSLNTEQLQMLPANPVGELELTDADLAVACGSLATLPGCAPVVPAGEVDNGILHASSQALICEINIFTINLNALIAVPLNLLSGPNGNCVGSH
jgi:mersacidin/lichenicidin family type 2 lantibiotic